MAHWGGIERVLADKMNLLVKMFGYEVYMLTADQGCHPIPYQLDKDIHLEDINIRFYQQYQYRGLKRFWLAYQLKKYCMQRVKHCIRTIKPDIIVCTTANYVDLDVLVKVKGDIPLIIESHSIFHRTMSGSGWKGLYGRYMFKRSFKKAHAVVTLTEGDALEWRKSQPNVKVIPNVVHLNEGRTSKLCNKHVIFVGRLDYQKCPMDVLVVWKKVFQRHPDWNLDIYGEGEQKGDLEEKLYSLNMNVNLYKPTSFIFDCYRDSSILVSTSLYEPFGLVFPEAMSCGLPVVAFDCPYGPSDIITDGVDGFLIKNRDVDAFVDKVCLLIEDEDLRRQMGQNGIASSQRYRADVIMPKWIELFKQLTSVP